MIDPDVVLYQLNHYKPLIDKALKMTEEYVSQQKLILVGGMAIDIALRVKGQSIYDDDTLPDYDIISDKNLTHANALAEILCKEGLPDINVINAIHITTVKVRMKNIVLLDATYVPLVCFEKIPYLEVNHLRVVHPHYQFIDQRSSLAHLMADTGMSLNVFNRLKKDVQRNNLLRELYPIESSDSKLSTKTIRIPLDLIRVDESKLEKTDSEAFIYTGASCLVGCAAYAIMMSLHANKMDEFKIVGNSLEITIPTDERVRVISCDIDSLKPFMRNPKMYRPLVNLKQISQIDGEFEYVDTYGSRVSCNIVAISSSLSVCIGSVDYLLMEMLRDRIYVSEEPYSHFYTELVNIVDTKRLEKDSDSIWWPSLNCYGIDDLAEYKIFALERIMDSELSKNLKPKNSYPMAPKCLTKSGFEHEESHYFRIDGTEDNEIKHSSYANVINEFKEYVDKKRNEIH